MRQPSLARMIRISLVLLALAAGGGYGVRYWTFRWEHHFDPVIMAAAARYQVDPALVKAVVWKESRFRADARGAAGELGLMQLMDPAAQEWAEVEKVYPVPEPHLLDPTTNTMAGTWYLRKMLQRYAGTDNPLPYALADYNAGRGNVLKWARGEAATNSESFVSRIGFPTTKAYIGQVISRREQYRDDFPVNSDALRSSPGGPR